MDFIDLYKVYGVGGVKWLGQGKSCEKIQGFEIVQNIFYMKILYSIKYKIYFRGNNLFFFLQIFKRLYLFFILVM